VEYDIFACFRSLFVNGMLTIKTRLVESKKTELAELSAKFDKRTVK
jgi:hypothetical protein